MPRAMIEDNNRVALRIHPDDKAILMRAVALAHTDLTAFVLQNALQAVKTVIEQSERARLSERDSLRVLELLQHPPEPNARLLAADRAIPTRL